MFYRFFLSLLLFCLNSGTAQNKNPELSPAPGYPLWLQVSEYRTSQTSGISFIKSDDCKKLFLLADDTGLFHSLEISRCDKLKFDRITLSDSAKLFISEFPKPDFEEITYDPHTNSVYVSIEGNGKNYSDFVGLFRIIFSGSGSEFEEIKAFEKIRIEPRDLFLKYVRTNIGYEGFAVDKNYFYLGLESFTENGSFTDSSVIFIAGKSDKRIIKEIRTGKFGIHSVCGLYSDKDFSLWGIDRNRRKIFHIIFDENFEISDYNLYDCPVRIPGYPEFTYSPSFESITIDDDGFIYLVDDPWREAFIPPEDVMNRLDDHTGKNFRELVPVIFKYQINYN